MHSTVTHSRYPVSVASCWATIMSPMLRTGSWGLVPSGNVPTWRFYSGMANETLYFYRSKRRSHPLTSLFCLQRWRSFDITENEWLWDKELCRHPLTPCLVMRKIDGRDFYIRQMKNLKASIPVEWLTGESFNFYAWGCGVILARAHARVGDVARIAGYCGNSPVLDESLARWAEAYGDQTEADHEALLTAIRRGQIKADVQSSDGE